jgi:hypothetical protein
MSLPQVTINELDGALGILPASAGKLFALVGVATGGPTNTPATFARIKDVVATFESGPLVEAAAHYIERYGRPVILVRTETSTDATVSAVASEATGTSVFTIPSSDPSPEPNDDYEVVVMIVKGGTVGTAGTAYRVSLDGGRSFGPTLALGTANTISVPDAGNLTFKLAAGTLVANDLHTATTAAPQWSSTDLAEALDALGASSASWELVHIVGPIDSTSFDTIETKIAGLFAAGKPHGWIGNTRIPTADETEAQYATALAWVANKATKFGALCGGGTKLVSSVSGRNYRRPVSYAYAAREASVSEEVDTADVNLGALVGVSIRDANGNPDEHDESVNPGLDDLRLVTLTTHGEGFPGVYVTRPRLLSPEGSDFYLLPHRRVLNLAHIALRVYFKKRLNKPVRCNSETGFILEAEALEIEAGARDAMRSVLLAKPKASDVQFTLSRTDNVLSTKTLTGQARVLPLAYPEYIDLDVGYYNPALQAQAA